MPPRRRRPRRRDNTAATASTPSTANVPAWALKRGQEFVDDFLTRRAKRRQERVDDLLDRVPPAVKREGKAAILAWAEALADEPRLVPLNAGDPRAPLPARRS